MNHLATFSLFLLMCSSGAMSQNYQVTNIRGTESLDPPVLDIKGSTAMIIHNTNFWLYSFPSSGPTAPIATSSAVHPAPIGYGPENVTMKNNGTSTMICYINYEFSANPVGWYLEYVSSPDGSVWTTPFLLEKVMEGSLSLFNDNILLQPSIKGKAFLYYRVLTDSTIRMANAQNFGPIFTTPITFLAGDAAHRPMGMSCKVMTVGGIMGTDNIFNIYCSDSSLYLIRSIEPNPPGSPVKIVSIMGSSSNFRNSKIVANPNGTLYVAASFWQMLPPPPGQFMPQTEDGVLLYKSTDYGSTWAFKDTVGQTYSMPYELQLTSTGTLVIINAENANLYMRSSLDGNHWSSPVQINPTANTATGKNSFGFSSALIDDANLGVAWIDTTTGYDEIFYRKIAIPAAPAVGVAETGSSTPGQFTLNQNYPNPFNPTTRISYQIPNASEVKLAIYDMLGREVAVLVNGLVGAGIHSLEFDGSALPSGIYFYRLQAGVQSDIRKLTLVK